MKIIILLGLSMLVTYAMCRPAHSRGADGRKKWSPRGRTLEDWQRNKGMTQARYQQYVQRIRAVKREIARRHNVKFEETDVDDKIDDMVLTLEQLDRMFGSERKKRSIMDYSYYTSSKWPLPIKYTFDGSHSTEQELHIKEAIKHWTDNTCITFDEITDGSSPADSFIAFTHNDNGCWSYIGRNVFEIPQPISMSSTGCFTLLGTAVHEIGHALGLWHEHTRPDRDTYVKVYEDNIRSDSVSNFELLTEQQSVDYSLPYDYSSVMHYSKDAFLKDGLDANTIETIDATYQQNLGQRFGLSFMDAQLVNKAYCSDVCTVALSCENGGYTDPKDCSRCRCPDGFTGTLCNEVSPGSGASLSPSSSAKIDVTSTTETCISASSYADGDTGNWLLEAPAGCTVKGRFVNTFGLLTYNDVCYHFVELKYKNMEENGPRFCGQTLPKFSGSEYVTSEGNKMLLMFRTPWDSSNNYPSSYRQGFEFCYSLDSAQCLSTSTTTTTAAPSTATTTTTTTTTTEQPSTTETSTTTTEKPTTTSTTTTEPTTTTTTSQPSTTTTTTEPSTTTTTTQQPTTTTATSTTTTTTAPTTATTSTTQQPTTTTTVPSTTTTTTEPTTTTTTTTSTPSTTAGPSTTIRASSRSPRSRPSLRPTRGPGATRPSLRPTRGPGATRPSLRPTRGPGASRPSQRPTRGPGASRPSQRPTREPGATRPPPRNGRGYGRSNPRRPSNPGRGYARGRSY